MKKPTTNPYRLVAQVVVIGLIIFSGIRTIFSEQFTADVEAYCPFGGIQAYSSFLVNKSLACSMTNLQISMGLMLIIAVVLFSKLFCSVACPVGTVSEWIGKLGDRWRVKMAISGLADKILRSLKYILLFITFYFSVTSSELFCKWFCPYFSIASGFNPDVHILMAITALAIVVFGSLFFRLFWCRYLCPINAISNIFRFIYLFIGITSVYFLIRMAGIELGFVWPLAILCILAYLFELGNLNNRPFPVAKIVRNETSCTSCKRCTKACPHAIPVDSLVQVRDVDCHLCGDCIHVCPEKGTLTINRSGKKWLPVLVIVILFIGGILFSRLFELPTVFEQWADKSDMQEMSTYTVSDLKSITCYGSSIVFANHMYDMDGVYGVATYLNGQRARIWYDAGETDTIAIREWIFSPAFIGIRDLPEDVPGVLSYSLRVDNFLDPLDGNLLAEILSEDPAIYGLSTEFACPVEVTVYYANDSDLSPDKLIELVEERAKKSRSKGERARTQNYKVTAIERTPKAVSRREYLQKMSGAR